MTAAGMTERKIPPEYRAGIEGCFKSASGPVYGFLRRMTGNRELAEDLVQETFRKCAQNWSELRNLAENERSAWLIRVAFNTAMDDRRRQETLERLQPRIRDLYLPPETDIYRQAMTSIAVQRFIEVTDKMPSRRRLVALLYWRCRWKNHEIAEELGITPGAVSQHVKEARKVLVKELGPHLPPGFTPEEEVPRQS